MKGLCFSINLVPSIVLYGNKRLRFKLFCRYTFLMYFKVPLIRHREGGGLVVQSRTPEREVGGSIPISVVLCP